MLVFRSEDHLKRWLERGHPKGESLTIDQQWALAQRWFEGRHLPEWRRRTPAEAEAVFRSVGLTSSFWSL
jgi:hypothetical protein